MWDQPCWWRRCWRLWGGGFVSWRRKRGGGCLVVEEVADLGDGRNLFVMDCGGGVLDVTGK